MIYRISNSRFNYPSLLDWVIVPLPCVSVLSTPHTESGFQYPTYQLSFEIPHLLDLVFHTPMLCFRFRYPYLGIWFSEPYV